MCLIKALEFFLLLHFLMCRIPGMYNLQLLTRTKSIFLMGRSWHWTFPCERAMLRAEVWAERDSTIISESFIMLIKILWKGWKQMLSENSQEPGAITRLRLWNIQPWAEAKNLQLPGCHTMSHQHRHCKVCITMELRQSRKISTCK